MMPRLSTVILRRRMCLNPLPWCRRFSSSVATCAATSASEDISTRYEEYGLYRLLTSTERGLLNEQRQLSDACRTLASQVFTGTEEASKILSKLSPSFLEDLKLESYFSVVIAGEFNAGKSTLINALLGKKLLESGALPTTDSITIVTSSFDNPAGKDEEESSTDGVSSSKRLPLGVVLHAVPNLTLLNDLALIDTPGTNSAWMDHTERTLRLLPSADLIIFVTSADRPFSESERTLLQGIQSYRKSIVIVVNKMDILDTDGGNHGHAAKQAVVDFVTDRSSELLGARPIVIPVSSRDALSVKLMEKPSVQQNPDQQRSNVWHRSNFGTLESFLEESLTEQAKLKSKLTNPIGVAEGVMKECLTVLEDQRQELQIDVATLNMLHTQFGGWQKELTADLWLFRQDSTATVRNHSDRWNLLFQRMNFWQFHYWVLVDQRRLEQEWEATKLQVSSHSHDGLKEDIIVQVQEVAESVATRGRAQGQAVIEYLGKRPAVKNQSLVGSVTAVSRFEDTRKNLQERLSRAVESLLYPDSEREEKEEVVGSLRKTAAVSIVLQSGAVGAALAVAMNMVGPIPGLAVATSLAVSCGACYSLGTASIAKRNKTMWSEKAQSLDKSLAAICDKEVDRVCRRILDGVSPYTRFVDGEQERIHSLQDQCEGLCAAARNLRKRINKLS